MPPFSTTAAYLCFHCICVYPNIYARHQIPQNLRMLPKKLIFGEFTAHLSLFTHYVAHFKPHFTHTSVIHSFTAYKHLTASTNYKNAKEISSYFHSFQIQVFPATLSLHSSLHYSKPFILSDISSSIYLLLRRSLKASNVF